jgi:hypothetical protein
MIPERRITWGVASFTDKRAELVEFLEPTRDALVDHPGKSGRRIVLSIASRRAKSLEPGQGSFLGAIETRVGG